MIVAEKRKSPGGPKGQPPGDEDVVTFKTRYRVKKTLLQIASLLGVNDQDVLNGYAEKFEEDLSELMAMRQLEIRTRQNPGSEAPS